MIRFVLSLSDRGASCHGLRDDPEFDQDFPEILLREARMGKLHPEGSFVGDARTAHPRSPEQRLEIHESLSNTRPLVEKIPIPDCDLQPWTVRGDVDRPQHPVIPFTPPGAGAPSDVCGLGRSLFSGEDRGDSQDLVYELTV